MRTLGIVPDPRKPSEPTDSASDRKAYCVHCRRPIKWSGKWDHYGDFSHLALPGGKPLPDALPVGLIQPKKDRA